MKNVMAAASKYKCGSLYENTKIGIPLHITLDEMNFTQRITQITTDNSTTDVIFNKRI